MHAGDLEGFARELAEHVWFEERLVELLQALQQRPDASAAVRSAAPADRREILDRWLPRRLLRLSRVTLEQFCALATGEARALDRTFPRLRARDLEVTDTWLIPAQGQVVQSDWLPLPDVLGTEALPARETNEKLQQHIEQSLVQVTIFGLIVVLFLPAIQFARNYLTEYVLGRVYVEMQRDLCSKLLALPMRYHDEQQRGDVLSRILADVRSAHSAVGLLFDDFVEAALMTVVGAGVLLFISWQLAAIFLLLGPALFGVITLFTRRISRSARRRQEKFGDVTQRLLEILAGSRSSRRFAPRLPRPWRFAAKPRSCSGAA